MTKSEINNPLAGILPPHTALTRNILGPVEWTWTTPDGVWTVIQHTGIGWIVSADKSWSVTGPGGSWGFPATAEPPQRMLALLYALGAIERAKGGPVRPGITLHVGEPAAPSIPSESRSNPT